MEKLKVKNVIISKQGKESSNFIKFHELVKKRKINVLVVKSGDKLAIDKTCYFHFLFPQKHLIAENTLNNNSIVTKFCYQTKSKEFSMLLTGDVEKIAEEKLVELYKETNYLQATVLKVAHHGSKTSSTEDFINLVKPKIALIGVGEKNTFGHPSQNVLNKLQQIRL